MVKQAHNKEQGEGMGTKGKQKSEQSTCSPLSHAKGFLKGH